MAVDPARQIEVLREKLEAGDRGRNEPDRTLILRFLKRMNRRQENYGAYRRIKLLRHVTRISEHTPTPVLENFMEAEETESAEIDSNEDVAELIDDLGILGGVLEHRAVTNAVVDWVNDNYDNEETNRDYRQALRTFGLEMYNGDDIAPSISWVSSSYPRNYDPTPSRIDILEWDDDVNPMIQAEDNDRTRAMMALAFDAGPRSGELYDLRVGDIDDANIGLIMNVNGKRGRRDVELILSVPYLNQWLQKHPKKQDKRAYLWARRDGEGRISERRMYDALQAAANRVDVTKKVTPTAFRKANACWLAENGVSEPEINSRQGRKQGSRQIARYVADFGPGKNVGYRRMLGIDVEDEEKSGPGVQICPRCGKETPEDPENYPRCVFCGQALTYDAISRAESQDEAIVERSLEETPESDMSDALRELRALLKEHPELRDASSALDSDRDSIES